MPYKNINAVLWVRKESNFSSIWDKTPIICPISQSKNVNIELSTQYRDYVFSSASQRFWSLQNYIPANKSL